MRNQYGITIVLLATGLGLFTPAFADPADEFQPKKTAPAWQQDSLKRLPPDVVIDNKASMPQQSALDKLQIQPNLWSGKSFHTVLHK